MQPIIVFTGASAAGKSRLLAHTVKFSQSSGLNLEAKILKRFTTRSQRENETFDKENEFLSTDEFAARVADGEIDVHWERSVGKTAKNYYGFSLRPHLKTKRTIILSGNNYLDWRKIGVLNRLRELKRLFVIRVVAEDATRIQRLNARVPKLSEEEFAFRMADVKEDELPPADFVICNDEEQQQFARWDLMRIISILKVSMNYSTNISLDALNLELQFAR